MDGGAATPSPAVAAGPVPGNVLPMARRPVEVPPGRPEPAPFLGADCLTWQRMPPPADVYVVGVHPGAGARTLAALVPGSAALTRSWPGPVPPGAAPVPAVLVARSSAGGLSAAQLAVMHWAAGLVPGIVVWGLAVVADAPGPLSRPLRGLRDLVAGGVPRVWDVPWVEAWHQGAPVDPDVVPPPVARFRDDVTTLLRTPAAGVPLPDTRGRHR